MKHILIIGMLFFTTITTLVAQKISSKQIVELIKQHDFETLSVHLSEKVVINLNEIEKNISKAEAVKLLTTFFEKHKPKNFAKKHICQAPSDKNGWLSTGVLKAGDLVLDTHFLVQNDLIVELFFEE